MLEKIISGIILVIISTIITLLIRKYSKDLKNEITEKTDQLKDDLRKNYNHQRLTSYKVDALVEVNSDLYGNGEFKKKYDDKVGKKIRDDKFIRDVVF